MLDRCCLITDSRFVQAIRSLALSGQQFNIIHSHLVNLKHISWGKAYRFPHQLPLVPSLVALDVANPNEDLLDMLKRLPNLRILSIYELYIASDDGQGWGTSWGGVVPPTHNKFERWLSNLRALSTIEQFAIGSDEVVAATWGSIKPEQVTSILGHLPQNLKLFIYSDSLEFLTEKAPSIFLHALTDTNHPLPPSLTKINFTTRHWQQYPQTTGRLTKFVKALSREGGLLSNTIRNEYVASGIELVAGEVWRSSEEEVGWAYPWDIDNMDRAEHIM